MRLPFSPFKSPLYVCGILAILCLVGCKQSPKNVSHDVPHNVDLSQNAAIFETSEKTFPQDLLYQGIPIHPSCIVATLHDKLPKPVSIQELHKNIPECDRGTGHTFSHDSESKTCSASWKLLPYGYDPEDPETAEAYPAWFDGYEHEVSYTYIGSYENKHIVVTRQDCSAGRDGPNSMLGIITRDDRTICCVGARHGDFADLSLEGNLLRFKEGATPAHIDYIVPRENIVDVEREITSISNELPTYDTRRGFWCLYEINLDDPLVTPTLYGIAFVDETCNYWYPTNKQEKCFDTVAMQYIDAGNRILDLAQTESFVKDVWKSIAHMVALNECEEK